MRNTKIKCIYNWGFLYAHYNEVVTFFQDMDCRKGGC